MRKKLFAYINTESEFEENVAEAVNRYFLNGADGLFKEVGLNVLHVVAVDDPDGFQSLDLQELLHILQQLVGLMGLTGLLFNKNAVNHSVSSIFL